MTFLEEYCILDVLTDGILKEGTHRTYTAPTEIKNSSDVL